MMRGSFRGALPPPAVFLLLAIALPAIAALAVLFHLEHRAIRAEFAARWWEGPGRHA